MNTSACSGSTLPRPTPSVVHYGNVEQFAATRDLVLAGYRGDYGGCIDAKPARTLGLSPPPANLWVG